MSNLREYLAHKKIAFGHIKARGTAADYKPARIGARVTAEGRSGIRRISVRGFQILSDSPPDFVGYDLGPSSPEIALGALGSCLTHTWLIQSAVHGLALDSLSVEVTGQLDLRTGTSGHDDVPPEPHDLGFTVHLETDARPELIEQVRRAVDRACPILNLLRKPQTIQGRLAVSGVAVGEAAG